MRKLPGFIHLFIEIQVELRNRVLEDARASRRSMAEVVSDILAKYYGIDPAKLLERRRAGRPPKPPEPSQPARGKRKGKGD